ncbi:MAG TPA: UPF0175 family protein [Candidatus Lokiarchaeia archaeon]|nr:UPF0175 family protein [Candidatus Lokiarchaeia archaeon]
MSERLSIVIPKKLKEELEFLRDKVHLDQSSLIRQILSEGIQQRKLDLAVAEYQKKKLSLGMAAELAGLNLWEFLEELHRRHVGLNYTLEEAENEIARINAGEYKQYVTRPATTE